MCLLAHSVCQLPQEFQFSRSNIKPCTPQLVQNNHFLYPAAATANYQDKENVHTMHQIVLTRNYTK